MKKVDAEALEELENWLDDYLRRKWESTPTGQMAYDIAEHVFAAREEPQSDALLSEAYQLISSAIDGGTDEHWKDAARDWVKEARESAAPPRQPASAKGETP